MATIQNGSRPTFQIGELARRTALSIDAIRFFENLPLNGRSFQTLIQLTPGVVLTPVNNYDTGQFSVNGQARNFQLLDGEWRERQHWHGCGRKRRAGARRFSWLNQRFGRDQQSGLGGRHAGVPYPDLYLRAGTRNSVIHFRTPGQVYMPHAFASKPRSAQT